MQFMFVLMYFNHMLINTSAAGPNSIKILDISVTVRLTQFFHLHVAAA